MSEDNKEKKFSYWKRPWGKWCLLLASVLLVIALLMDISDYRDILSAGVLSPEAQAQYIAGQKFGFALRGLNISMFFGIFVVGQISRSERMARRNEGILLLLLLVGWMAVGMAWGLFSRPGGQGFFCIAIGAALLALSAYNIAKFYRMK